MHYAQAGLDFALVAVSSAKRDGSVDRAERRLQKMTYDDLSCVDDAKSRRDPDDSQGFALMGVQCGRGSLYDPVHSKDALMRYTAASSAPF
jgi:hypothetical protein